MPSGQTSLVAGIEENETHKRPRTSSIRVKADARTAIAKDPDGEIPRGAKTVGRTASDNRYETCASVTPVVSRDRARASDCHLLADE